MITIKITWNDGAYCLRDVPAAWTTLSSLARMRAANDISSIEIFRYLPR